MKMCIKNIAKIFIVLGVVNMTGQARATDYSDFIKTIAAAGVKAGAVPGGLPSPLYGFYRDTRLAMDVIKEVQERYECYWWLVKERDYTPKSFVETREYLKNKVKGIAGDIKHLERIEDDEQASSSDKTSSRDVRLRLLDLQNGMIAILNKLGTRFLGRELEAFETDEPSTTWFTYGSYNAQKIRTIKERYACMDRLFLQERGLRESLSLQEFIEKAQGVERALEQDIVRLRYHGNRDIQEGTRRIIREDLLLLEGIKRALNTFVAAAEAILAAPASTSAGGAAAAATATVTGVGVGGGAQTTVGGTTVIVNPSSR